MKCGIYRIDFTVDTGYEYKRRTCIIMAANLELATENFQAWFSKVAPTESIIVDNLTDIVFITSVIPVNGNDYGMIIYQDYRRE